jgi:hypothetical protein|tara:strand:- start:18 stop:467 length:450 start_codon:yes stop_codon:yes gene_type:complete
MKRDLSKPLSSTYGDPVKKVKVKSVTRKTKTQQSDWPGNPKGMIDSRSSASDSTLIGWNKSKRNKWQTAEKDHGKGKGNFKKPTAKEQKEHYNKGLGNWISARKSPGERYNDATNPTPYTKGPAAYKMPTIQVDKLKRVTKKRTLKKKK